MRGKGEEGTHRLLQRLDGACTESRLRLWYRYRTWHRLSAERIRARSWPVRGRWLASFRAPSLLAWSRLLFAFRRLGLRLGALLGSGRAGCSCLALFGWSLVRRRLGLFRTCAASRGRRFEHRFC